MAFQGNWIDLLIIIVLLVWVTDGWDRGFFVLFSDLLAFLGAFLFGLRFYSRAAMIFVDYFSISRGISNALGFFLVYSLAHFIILSVLVRVLKDLPKKVPQLWQKFLGVFPALLNGIIVISALLTLAVSLPLRSDVKQAISESEIGGYLVRRTTRLERALDSVFGEAIDESLAFLTVEPQGGERVDLGFSLDQPELVVSEQLESAMFALLNGERQERGIGVLQWDAQIVPAARSHAQDMFERGYFSHLSPEGEDVGDRLIKAGVSYVVAGENLALAPTLEMAHDGLMQSQGHRDNILSQEFGRVGIGVIDGGRYGKMFVQVFAD